MEENIINNMQQSWQQSCQLIRSIGEEILGDENLEKLLTYKNTTPGKVVAYDGFEPSGRMHIAQGLLRAHNVNKFIKAGVRFKFWVADWFALMNLKMGGDINKIQKAGQLMIHTWKACGMDLDATDPSGNPMVEFIWSSEEINKRSDDYWKLVLDIGTKFSLTRIKRCTQIMGRKEENDSSDSNNNDMLIKLNNDIETLFLTTDLDEIASLKGSIKSTMNILLENNKPAISNNMNISELAASQIFYPVMQCADVFFLGVDICSLGIDQRKVNILALEYCDKIKRKNKPIIVSHHMIMGLDGSDKMSKSNPDNTIFMDDGPTDVKRKITKAFCEPGNITKNPLLDWIKWLILPITNSITICNTNYSDYNKLESDFKEYVIHPSDLKKSMIETINRLLEPVSEYFAVNLEASKLLEMVRKYR
jgi:tyrosyl-tRNA synthetase